MAFAMATHAKVLLMDEPTNGLDITSKQQFRDFIRQGSHESQLIVISTHQVKDVESILNHVLLMDRSEIIRNEAINGTIDLETYFIEATKGREAHHD
jgi:ABC transporter, ATP-binding protein